MIKPTCRLAVLISGAGSTFVNLHDHIQRGLVRAELAVVVSSRKSALGLTRAAERGIPTAVVSRRPYVLEGGTFDAAAYSHALVDALASFAPNLIVMAGFMTRLAPSLLERYDVINVHPALLPMFGGDGCFGHHVHEAVLSHGVKFTGATVHFADSAYDTGPIILQEAVPVLESDTPETLAARVQMAERRLYPEAIRLYCDGRLRREGRRVRILPLSRGTE